MIMITLTGCAWFEQSHHERIVYDYEVGWNDLVRNRSIRKPIRDCSGCPEVVVGGYVYAVGHNDSFIIAKQHSGIDTTMTYYYIIDIERHNRYVIDIERHNKYGGNKGVYESLNKLAFDSLRKQLKISNIQFDLNYPKNP